MTWTTPTWKILQIPQTLFLFEEVLDKKINNLYKTR
jgi:hypothetical protein